MRRVLDWLKQRSRDLYVKYQMKLFLRSSDPVDPLIDYILESVMSERWNEVTYDQFEGRVVTDNLVLKFWNVNYPYAWIQRGTIVVPSKNFAFNWSDTLPSLWVTWKFRQRLIKEGKFDVK